MKKKLAITAILLQGNDYFILDEPYNGLDLQSCVLLTEIIKRLKKLNKTVLISSHIYSTLEECCDEILLLENGRFKERVTKQSFGRLNEQIKEKILIKEIDKIFN